MAVLKAASEHGSFDVVPPVTSLVPQELNSGISRRYFDERYVRSSILAAQSGATPNYWGLNLAAPRTNVWLHIDWSFTTRTNSGSVNKDKECFSIVDPSGNPIVEIRGSSGPVYRLSYYSGSSPSDLHGPVSITAERVQTFDLFVDLVARTVQLYQEGALVFSAFGSVAPSASQIGGMRITGRGLQGYFSQVIMADESTVGWRATLGHALPLYPPDPFGFPTFQEWATANGGDITHPQYNETRYIATPAPGVKQSIIKRLPVALPVGGPQNIAAVVFYTAGQATSAVDTNKYGWFLFRGGLITELPNFTVPKTNTRYMTSVVMPINPTTGSAWNPADFGTFEMGVITS